jgi:prepilin-type N-terminal cleavage/methylation domain-containing protein
MNRSSRQRRSAAAGRGFTLVEILATITIIAILAGLVMGGMVVARQSAREAATKTTIAKLHNIIMKQWDSYATRRVPINFMGIDPKLAATNRLAALRDLMRMEMPERVTDIFNLDASGNLTSWRGPSSSLPNQPSLLQAYASRAAAGWASATSRGEQQAECLYMIVSMVGGQDVMRQFGTAEIGDTNGNGLPEFLDGWGHPIRFLRWAPGFNDSDLQANVVTQADLDTTTRGNEIDVWKNTGNSAYANVLAARQTASLEDHDPLDPRRVDMGPIPVVSGTSPHGWRLVPLIYSAGPDGEYGVGAYPTGASSDMWWDPAASGTCYDHYKFGFGIPTRNADGTWVHFDNIHNHRLEVK